MTFRITIEETKTVENNEQGAYAIVGTEVIQVTAFDHLNFEEQKKYKSIGNGQYERNVYDYPPARVISKKVTEKLYEQQVETMDIPAVIQAVLGSRR